MPQFTDAYGITIVYDRYDAEGTPRGVVQVLHGVGEHAGRYATLISALTAAGFHVYADDHRGHGRTGILQWNDPEKLGHLGKGGLDAAVEAVHQLSLIAKDEHPELPLILLGHSWGSFLSQILLDKYAEDYAAVILSGSALRWPGTLNAGDLNKRWSGPDAHGLEWLSGDPSVWHAFREDPLTTEKPLLKLFGVVNAAKLFGKPAKGLRERLGREVPLLIMVGRDDSVGGPVSVHKLAKAYRDRSGFSDVTTLVYPDARHEIFNDYSQEQVRADLLGWLNSRFPAEAAE